MSTAPVNNDLNEIIGTAVNARIEAAVLESLSGDQFIGQYVMAALNQTVEVGDRYDKVKTTFLNNTLTVAIQKATRAAVENQLALMAPEIEAAVAAQLRKQAKALATSMMDAAQQSVAGGYGIKVDVKLNAGRD